MYIVTLYILNICALKRHRCFMKQAMKHFLVCISSHLIPVTIYFIGVTVRSGNNTQCYYQFESDISEKLGAKLTITMKPKS